MISLHIRGVYFSYLNGLVLHDINLAVAAGEMVGLLGPNGSGKTTLIKLVREVFSASVRVAPHPATGVPHIIVMPKGNTITQSSHRG